MRVTVSVKTVTADCATVTAAESTRAVTAATRAPAMQSFFIVLTDLTLAVAV